MKINEQFRKWQNLERVFFSSKDEDMEKFRKFVEKKWLPLPSNTQFVESGVKESKLCCTNRQSENKRSQYTTIRSHIVEDVIMESKKKRDQEDKKFSIQINSSQQADWGKENKNSWGGNK